MKNPEPVNITTYAGSEMTLAFDILTGQRIAVEGETMPGGEEIHHISDLTRLLLQRAEEESALRILREYKKKDLLQIVYRKGEIRSARLRLKDLRKPEEETLTYRWYRLVYTCVSRGEESPAVLLISAYDITEEVYEQERQFRLAKYDPYTGFPRKEYFEGVCHRMQDDRSYENALNAVVIVSIDQFDEIRSRTSMSVCDHYVQQVAEVLRPFVENEEKVARMSDSEFLLTFHKCESLPKLRTRILEMQQSVRVPMGDHRYITVSVGAAVCHHDASDCYHCSYETARAALRQARQNGIGQVMFYSDLEGEARLTPEGLSSREPEMRDVYLRTFGRFEVLVDGRKMNFHSKKSRELLALLVDRRGDGLTSGEAIGYLWPDETTDSTTHARYRKIAYRLKKELEENGIGEILRVEDSKRSLDLTKVRCDYYDYLAHPDIYANLYKGEYMEDFDWRKERQKFLEGIRQKQSDDTSRFQDAGEAQEN